MENYSNEQESIKTQIKKLAEQGSFPSEENNQSNLIGDSAKFFIQFYKGHPNFRHDYSELFPLIQEFSRHNSKYDLETLVYNLDLLKDQILKTNLTEEDPTIEDSITGFLNLYDYLELEIKRFQYYSERLAITETLKHNCTDIEKSLRKVRGQLNKAVKKSENLQLQVVTILSVFAAIVLAFMGGISFSSESLASLAALGPTDKINNLVIMMSVCGIVLFNTIVALLYVVSRIVGRPIWTKCKAEDCRDCDQGCNPFCRLWKRWIYIWTANALFIIIFLVAWIDLLIKGRA